jgi:hypothetical protein
MRKTLALLFLGLAMAQEVVVYPGYAEIRDWTYAVLKIPDKMGLR